MAGENDDTDRERDNSEADGFGHPDNPDRIARRAALKKAAVAAAAAGAVWAAPAVEGLSIVPSYAAAATAPAGSPTTIITIGSAGSEKNVGSGCNPGSHWWAMTQLLTSPFPIRNHPGTAPGPGSDPAPGAGGPFTHTNTPAVSVTGPVSSRGGVPGPYTKPSSWPSEPASVYTMQDNAFTVNAPLGTGVGNVSISTPQPLSNSGSDVSNFAVVFNVDPPFNKCRVTEAIFHGCDFSNNGNNNNEHLNSWNNPDGGLIWSSLGSATRRPTVNNTAGVNATNFNNNVSNFTSNVTVDTTPTPNGNYYTDGNTNYAEGARAIQFKISCV